ncbi:MAG: hypothetical protein ACPGOV_02215 [Magnetovibrionaceae bacterium]
MADKPHLGLIVFSGTFEKVHYALVLASTALALNRPVTLFFTQGACGFLSPDWRSLPSEHGATAGAVDDSYKQKGIGDFRTLLDAARELGAEIMVCEMGLKAIDLSADALDPAIQVKQGGALTFLKATEDAQLLFI